MSVFTGRVYRGAMREHRAALRDEANARAAETKPERTKAFRKRVLAELEAAERDG